MTRKSQGTLCCHCNLMIFNMSMLFSVLISLFVVVDCHLHSNPPKRLVFQKSAGKESEKKILLAQILTSITVS